MPVSFWDLLKSLCLSFYVKMEIVVKCFRFFYSIIEKYTTKKILPKTNLPNKIPEKSSNKPPPQTSKTVLKTI